MKNYKYLKKLIIWFIKKKKIEIEIKTKLF